MTNTTIDQVYYCPSTWPLDMPRSHLVVWAVMMAILSPITILANSALIYGLYKTQQLKTITNKFTLIMNMSDLCLGIFVLPLTVAMICVKDAFRSCKFELFVQYSALLFAYFSFCMLFCVSIDRYLHISKLNRYNQFMNTCRMKSITVVSFVYSVFMSYLPMLSSLELGFCSFMLFLYSLALRKITIHTDNFRRKREEQGKNESRNRESKKEVSATKTIRFALVALVALYLPYVVCSVGWAYYKVDRKVNPPLVWNVVIYWSYIIVVSNTGINAIIFSYGNSTVRRFFITRFSLARNHVFSYNANAQISNVRR